MQQPDGKWGGMDHFLGWPVMQQPDGKWGGNSPHGELIAARSRRIEAKCGTVKLSVCPGMTGQCQDGTTMEKDMKATKATPVMGSGAEGSAPTDQGEHAKKDKGN